MKKNIPALLFVTLFLIGSIATAFAAAPIPDISSAPAYSYSPATGEEKVLNQLKGQTKELKLEAKKMADEGKVAKQQHTAAINSFAEALKSKAEADKDLAGAVKGSNSKIDVVSSKINVGALFLGALIVLAVIIVLLRLRKVQSQTVKAMEPAINRFNETADKIEKESTSVATTIGSAKYEILAAIKAAKEEVISEVPAKTAGINELQRPFVLNGIHGKDYRINPIMMEGKVRTLKLVKDLDEDDFDSPSEFTRTPAKSLTHLKATNTKMLTMYFDPAFKCTDSQKSVIASAISSGEIEEI